MKYLTCESYIEKTGLSQIVDLLIPAIVVFLGIQVNDFKM